MNLLSKFWNWFTTPNTEPCCDTPQDCDDDCPEGECCDEPEEQLSVQELFIEVCTDLGIGQKILDSTDAVSKFEEWYTGEADKQSVLDSIKDFADSDGVVNVKFQQPLRLAGMVK
jgi:hypothetical protein